MKKNSLKTKRTSKKEVDTMRPEYDFSRAVRGVTAARYAKGSNVVVIDPDVVKIFPDSVAVNDALRALAGIVERTSRTKSRKKSA